MNPVPAPTSTPLPADLEIRVTTEDDGDALVLAYSLHSPNGRFQLSYAPFPGARIRRSDDWQEKTLKTLEKLHRGNDSRNASLVGQDVATELARLGEVLAGELFPAELQRALEDVRQAETVLLVSDEPWIPWEIVRPYDHDFSREEDPDDWDNGFLGSRFQLTRWLAGATTPAAHLEVFRLGVIEAGSPRGLRSLEKAEDELRFLSELASRHGVGEQSLADATHPRVLAHLREHDLNLIHFVGHGEHDADDPGTSGLHLHDQRTFRPRDLSRDLQGHLRANRPLVFLNACHAGRQGWSMTRLGGWAPRFVLDAGSGAFVAPLWTVRDTSAHVFAKTFYKALEGGETFGRAALEARRALRDDPLGRMAYAVYAHPNAKVRFGGTPLPKPRAGSTVTRSGVAQACGSLERLRRHSEIAATDADFIGDEGERTRGPILLSQGLYVERAVEVEIRELLLERRGGDAILINGPAGRGKTSLLWRLYSWLRSLEEPPETWLVKAGLLRLQPEAGRLSTEDLVEAARTQEYRQGEPIVLLDTVDLLLHTEAERDAFVSSLYRLLDEGCTVVTSCRVQESVGLPYRLRKNTFLLDRYLDSELEEAVRRHVDRFYDRPQSREAEEHVRRLHNAVARGYPLREVCANPLTLRMLFVLYAPHEVHDLEIKVFELYRDYWQKRVARDERAGAAPGMASHGRNLEATAGAVALTMLAEGRPELSQDFVESTVGRFHGRGDAIAQLTDRGVLHRSGEKTLSFFHQTFLEHSAARGLLRVLKERGLTWLGRRFFESLEDLFVAPIFEQVLLLSQHQIRSVRERAEGLQCDLLRHEHLSARTSGLYVYAHSSNPSTEIQEAVRSVLKDGDTIVVNAYLDVAANIAASRDASLFDEMDVIWQRGQWKEQLRLFDLLERVAPRQPKQVQAIFDRWSVHEWEGGVDKLRQIDDKILQVVVALLPEDPAWGWQWLVSLYRNILRKRGYRKVHVDLVSALADHASLLEPSSIATRFLREVGEKKVDKVYRPLAKAWGRLWRCEWKARTLTPGVLLRELETSPSPLHLYSWLEGMAELLVEPLKTSDVCYRWCPILIRNSGVQAWPEPTEQRSTKCDRSSIVYSTIRESRHWSRSACGVTSFTESVWQGVRGGTSSTSSSIIRGQNSEVYNMFADADEVASLLA